MKKYFFIGLILILVFALSACKETKDIQTIYIYHSAFGQIYPEFKIDLVKKEVWEFKVSSISNYAPRDPSAENEGFSFLKSLDDESIEKFIRDYKKCGFSNWKTEYINYNILDGHQWGITIIFSDSTSKEITGSNKYPASWNKMKKAFLDLTGEDILIYERNWV